MKYRRLVRSKENWRLHLGWSANFHMLIALNKEAGIYYHNINFIILLDLLEDAPLTMQEGTKSPCRWLALEALSTVDLKPAFKKRRGVERTITTHATEDRRKMTYNFI